jgi:hypothetical protein
MARKKKPAKRKTPPKPAPSFDSADISYGSQGGSWGTGAKLQSGKPQKKPRKP